MVGAEGFGFQSRLLATLQALASKGGMFAKKFGGMRAESSPDNAARQTTLQLRAGIAQVLGERSLAHSVALEDISEMRLADISLAALRVYSGRVEDWEALKDTCTELLAQSVREDKARADRNWEKFVRTNLAKGASGAHRFCNAPNVIQASALHKNSPDACDDEAVEQEKKRGEKWKAGCEEEAVASADALAMLREKALAAERFTPDFSPEAIATTAASSPGKTSLGHQWVPFGLFKKLPRASLIQFCVFFRVLWEHVVWPRRLLLVILHFHA